MAHFQVPETNISFPFEPLPEGTIRLLRFLPSSTATDIHCALEVREILLNGDRNDQQQEHVALSYLWGEPDFSKRITVNDHALYVTENLEAALRTLQRHDAQTFYWVDAICINQLDVQERSEQVQQMWKIFSSAKYVISWLGEADDLAHKVVQAVERLNQSIGRGDDYMGEDYILFNRLERQPYFKRAWIISEMLQAREIHIMWHSCGIEWKHLKDLQRPFGNWWPLTYRRLPPQDSLCWTLSSTIHLYQGTRATDIRDKIFAMLGDPFLQPWQDQIILRADYTMSMEDVAIAVLQQWCVPSILNHKDAQHRTPSQLFTLVLMADAHKSVKFREALVRQIEMVQHKWSGESSRTFSATVKFRDVVRPLRLDVHFLLYFLALTPQSIAALDREPFTWDDFGVVDRFLDRWQAQGFCFDWPSQWPKLPQRSLGTTSTLDTIDPTTSQCSAVSSGHGASRSYTANSAQKGRARMNRHQYLRMLSRKHGQVKQRGLDE